MTAGLNKAHQGACYFLFLQPVAAAQACICVIALPERTLTARLLVRSFARYFHPRAAVLFLRAASLCLASRRLCVRLPVWVTVLARTGTDHQKIAKLDRDNEVAPPSKIPASVGKVRPPLPPMLCPCLHAVCLTH